MKIPTCSALIMATVLLFGTAARATVITDYDRHANFPSYKTYSWARVDTPDSMWTQRIKSAVDSQLSAKGWKQVDSGGDVVIRAFGGVAPAQDVHVTGDVLGGPGWFGGGFGDATATKNTNAVGALVIEMFDASSKNMVWRGFSDDTLSTNSDKSVRNLNKDVEKMFKKSPPGSNGK
jgi:hypothetical protein